MKERTGLGKCTRLNCGQGLSKVKSFIYFNNELNTPIPTTILFILDSIKKTYKVIVVLVKSTNKKQYIAIGKNWILTLGFACGHTCVVCSELLPISK